MKKKVIFIVFCILILCNITVLATESKLLPITDANDLQNVELLDGVQENKLIPTTDAETLRNTVLVDEIEKENDFDEDSYVPENWRRDMETPTLYENSATSDIELVSKNDFQYGEEYIEISNKEIDGNAYYFAEKINVHDIAIKGDMYILSGSINIKNIDIDGNLYLLGSETNLENVNVDGNIYNLSVSININGAMVDDIFSISSYLNISGKTFVNRNLEAMCSEVQLEDVGIYRKADIFTENISVSEATSIGELNYIAEKPADGLESASIGNVNFTYNEKKEVQQDAIKSTMYNAVFSVFTGMVTTLFVAFYIILGTNNSFIERRRVSNIISYIGKSILIGALLLIFVPIVFMALLMTVVGIPMAFAIIALYVVILIISLPLVSLTIAAWATREKPEKKNLAVATFIIAFAIAILSKLPYIGPVISLCVGCSGLGLIFIGDDKNIKDKNETAIKTFEQDDNVQEL